MPPAPTPPPAPGPAPWLAHYLAHPGQVTHQLLAHLALLAVGLATSAAPVLLLAGAAITALALAHRAARGRRGGRGARFVAVLAPPQVDPAGAATLWTNLVALLHPAWRRVLCGQPHLSFELVASAGSGLGVGIWVPAGVPPGLVEAAVGAAWPGARTTTAEPAPPLPARARATGGRLRLATAEHYPLRTEHAADPYRSLLGALGALSDAESACVQVLARPTTGRRLAGARRAAAARRSGRPASRLARALDLATPGPGGRPAETDPARAGDVAAILDKAAQPAWAVEIRYAVATSAADRGARGRLRGRAHAIAAAFALYAGRNRLARRRLHRPAAALAARRLGRGQLVSVAELAALAHLPTDASVPGLARAGARSVAPPPAVGAVGKILGDAEAGTRRAVALAVPDARHHLHVLGATGSGKSTLLANLVLSDIEAHRGVVVIDPKGDLVTDLLDRLPASAAGRVVLIDPDDPRPPALNVLEGPDADLVVDNLVGIFSSIFERFWGPRTDDVLRSACLTLRHHAARTGVPATLADVPVLLSDAAFRARATAGLADPAGLGGFWAWYEGLGDSARAQAVGPLLNKLRAFLLRDFVASVVGQAASSFDMAAVLDSGACFVRVPKGSLGEEAARLLGSFVVARVWQAAAERARLPQAGRSDASLVVDEAQNFLTLPRSFSDMLAEARGYRLSLTLAHQHLGQLPRELREAISANARTKVIFACSPEDAHTLERHVAPELSAHDLAHLRAHVAAARLVVAGAETAAFTLATRPAPPAIPGRAKAVRRASRAAYGADPARAASRALAGRRRPGEPGGGDRDGGALVPPGASPVASPGGPPVAPRPDGPLARRPAGRGGLAPSPGSPDCMEDR